MYCLLLQSVIVMCRKYLVNPLLAVLPIWLCNKPKHNWLTLGHQRVKASSVVIEFKKIINVRTIYIEIYLFKTSDLTTINNVEIMT